MRNRTFTSVLLSTLAALTLVTVGAGCGGPKKNTIMADTPALPYQAPDADEIAGTDEEEEELEEEEAAPTPAPAPAPAPVPASAQNPQK